MGKCDNRVLKEIARYKRKKTQEAGINCKIKRFLIYIVNTLRYRVVTISKTWWIADVTTRTRGHDRHPQISRCGVTQPSIT